MEALNMEEAQLTSEWCRICGRETLFLLPSRYGEHEPLHGISEGWLVHHHYTETSATPRTAVYCPEHAERTA